MKFQNLSTYRYWEMNKILKDSLEKKEEYWMTFLIIMTTSEVNMT